MVDALPAIPETFALVTEPPEAARDLDVVLGVPSYFSLGFLRPGPTVWFGSSQRALGAPGAGGSFGFADPDARVGYAYVMNKLDFYLQGDPREQGDRVDRERILRGWIDRLTVRQVEARHVERAGQRAVRQESLVELEVLV